MMTPKLNFSLPEFEARLTKTRTAKEDQGIDTLIVSDSTNMNWLPGYEGCVSFLISFIMTRHPRRFHTQHRPQKERRLRMLSFVRTFTVGPGI